MRIILAISLLFVLMETAVPVLGQRCNSVSQAVDPYVDYIFMERDVDLSNFIDGYNISYTSDYAKKSQSFVSLQNQIQDLYNFSLSNRVGVSIYVQQSNNKQLECSILTRDNYNYHQVSFGKSSSKLEYPGLSSNDQILVTTQSDKDRCFNVNYLSKNILLVDCLKSYNSTHNQTQFYLLNTSSNENSTVFLGEIKPFVLGQRVQVYHQSTNDAYIFAYTPADKYADNEGKPIMSSNNKAEVYFYNASKISNNNFGTIEEASVADIDATFINKQKLQLIDLQLWKNFICLLDHSSQSVLFVDYFSVQANKIQFFINLPQSEVWGLNVQQNGVAGTMMIVGSNRIWEYQIYQDQLTLIPISRSYLLPHIVQNSTRGLFFNRQYIILHTENKLLSIINRQSGKIETSLQDVDTAVLVNTNNLLLVQYQYFLVYKISRPVIHINPTVVENVTISLEGKSIEFSLNQICTRELTFQFVSNDTTISSHPYSQVKAQLSTPISSGNDLSFHLNNLFVGPNLHFAATGANTTLNQEDVTLQNLNAKIKSQFKVEFSLPNLQTNNQITFSRIIAIDDYNYYFFCQLQNQTILLYQCNVQYNSQSQLYTSTCVDNPRGKIINPAKIKLFNYFKQQQNPELLLAINNNIQKQKINLYDNNLQEITTIELVSKDVLSFNLVNKAIFIIANDTSIGTKSILIYTKTSGQTYQQWNFIDLDKIKSFPGIGATFSFEPKKILISPPTSLDASQELISIQFENIILTLSLMDRFLQINFVSSTPLPTVLSGSKFNLYTASNSFFAVASGDNGYIQQAINQDLNSVSFNIKHPNFQFTVNADDMTTAQPISGMLYTLMKDSSNTFKLFAYNGMSQILTNSLHTIVSFDNSFSLGFPYYQISVDIGIDTDLVLLQYGSAQFYLYQFYHEKILSLQMLPLAKSNSYFGLINVNITANSPNLNQNSQIGTLTMTTSNSELINDMQVDPQTGYKNNKTDLKLYYQWDAQPPINISFQLPTMFSQPVLGYRISCQECSNNIRLINQMTYDKRNQQVHGPVKDIYFYTANSYILLLNGTHLIYLNNDLQSAHSFFDLQNTGIYSTSTCKKIIPLSQKVHGEDKLSPIYLLCRLNQGSAYLAFKVSSGDVNLRSTVDLQGFSSIAQIQISNQFLFVLDSTGVLHLFSLVSGNLIKKIDADFVQDSSFDTISSFDVAPTENNDVLKVFITYPGSNLLCIDLRISTGDLFFLQLADFQAIFKSQQLILPPDANFNGISVTQLDVINNGQNQAYKIFLTCQQYGVVDVQLAFNIPPTDKPFLPRLFSFQLSKVISLFSAYGKSVPKSISRQRITSQINQQEYFAVSFYNSNGGQNELTFALYNRFRQKSQINPFLTNQQDVNMVPHIQFECGLNLLSIQPSDVNNINFVLSQNSKGEMYIIYNELQNNGFSVINVNVNLALEYQKFLTDKQTIQFYALGNFASDSNYVVATVQPIQLSQPSQSNNQIIENTEMRAWLIIIIIIICLIPVTGIAYYLYTKYYKKNENPPSKQQKAEDPTIKKGVSNQNIKKEEKKPEEVKENVIEKNKQPEQQQKNLNQNDDIELEIPIEDLRPQQQKKDEIQQDNKLDDQKKEEPE